jgi:hypothetical protein
MCDGLPFFRSSFRVRFFAPRTVPYPGVLIHAWNTKRGCGVDQRVLENDFVVVTGTGTARDFTRLLNVELHCKDKEKAGLPGLPIEGRVKIAK